MVVSSKSGYDLGTDDTGQPWARCSLGLPAARRSRKQFLDEYNNPEHYRPELPSSNRKHALEIKDGKYYGD